MTMNVNDKIIARDKAMSLIFQYGGIDGGHHKQWLLDQVLTILAGDEYEGLITEWEKPDEGDDPDDFYTWDTGIAP